MTERRELADTREIKDSEREQREGWEQGVKDWLVSTALLTPAGRYCNYTIWQLKGLAHFRVQIS